MFYLQNGMAIDVEGVLDGMLDERPYAHHILDANTGDVSCSPGIAVKRLDPARYYELPKISDEERGEWMEEFIREFVAPSDPALAAKLHRTVRGAGLGHAISMLKSKAVDAKWFDGWYEWEGTCTFDVFDEWLESQPIPVTYDPLSDGCGECAVCKAVQKAVEEGRAPTFEELEEAFKEVDEN